MKLKKLHSGGLLDRELPHQDHVIQPEEHRGAKHPKRWYSGDYAAKPKPYRQSKRTGPYPEDYDRHIMRETHEPHPTDLEDNDEWNETDWRDFTCFNLRAQVLVKTPMSMNQLMHGVEEWGSERNITCGLDIDDEVTDEDHISFYFYWDDQLGEPNLFDPPQDPSELGRINADAFTLIVYRNTGSTVGEAYEPPPTDLPDTDMWKEESEFTEVPSTIIPLMAMKWLDIKEEVINLFAENGVTVEAIDRHRYLIQGVLPNYYQAKSAILADISLPTSWVDERRSLAIKGDIAHVLVRIDDITIPVHESTGEPPPRHLDDEDEWEDEGDAALRYSMRQVKKTAEDDKEAGDGDQVNRPKSEVDQS